MKFIIQLVLISAVSLFGNQALASNHSYSWNHSYKKQHSHNYWKKQQKQYNVRWSNNGNNGRNWWSSGSWWGNNGNRHHRGGNNGWRGGHNGWQGGRQAHAVPELDASTAPLAALLLSGLLAAGFERRRRKQLKTIEN